MTAENLQLTDTLAMVRPNYFGFNPETSDNEFQNAPGSSESAIRKTAMEEFNKMVEVLENNKLNVAVLDSPLGDNGQITPDAVFPNNWFSTHPGTLVIYPMKAENRRRERQPEALKDRLLGMNILYSQTIDLTDDEKSGQILEGTGSLVLDRVNKIAYAIESQRTSEQELNKWSEIMGYTPFFFHAQDLGDKPVYHTNVIMSVGDDFAVVCTDAIRSANEKEKLFKSLSESGKTLVNISMEQMYDMCGNVLQTINTDGERLIVMSERARKAFTKDNLKVLEKSGLIVPVNIQTIENVGGGSARCMMAEIFKS